MLHKLSTGNGAIQFPCCSNSWQQRHHRWSHRTSKRGQEGKEGKERAKATMTTRTWKVQTMKA